eukprot:maker-scaffold_9-snap-gene-8.52-mRNA-1 protein AED:0.20 eAED:0.21 QI:0/0/0/1/0/0/3/0/1177
MIPKVSIFSLATLGVLKASDFDAFPEFLPSQIDISSITPLFDFTDNSYLPGVAISMEGERNGGLNPSGSVTGECRSSNFLDQSNTIHRHACVTNGGQDYCMHAFSLYFEKDQSLDGGGTRHELETVGVWTLDGAITHISVSDDTFLETFPVSDVSFQGSNPLIVYDAVSDDESHRFVLASSSHQIENPTGSYVTPDIISWFEFSAGDFDNTVFRALLSSRFDFGAVDFLLKDELFLDAFNAVKPANYPFLTFTSAQEPNPQPSDEFVRFLNVETGTCLNAAGGEANENVNLIVYECGTDFNEFWYFQESTQQIRSLEDPSFCVDVDQTIQAGENVQLKSCDSAKSSQQWTRSGNQILLSGLAMSSESGGTNVQIETNQNLNRQIFELFLLPTNSPTNAPTTLEPTNLPTQNPSTIPTSSPTTTFSPTFSPTTKPTESPSTAPTPVPSSSPTFLPSFSPSVSPTKKPTFFPTAFPIISTNSPESSSVPTMVPTNGTVEEVDDNEEGVNFLEENLFYLIIGSGSLFILAIFLSIFRKRRKNRNQKRLDYDARRDFVTIGVLKASDFDAFPEFLPSQIDISSITPLFDFTDNSCLPGVAISMEGERNGGLNPSGSVTGECRSSNFLDQSNTIHRYACVTNGGQDYCLHAFSLYFEKDQSTSFFGGGTRHELETVGVWTLDGAITDISVSDDTFLETFPVSDASFQGSNPLIVYAAVSGDNSHRFVLASSNHQVQNPTGVYVTPDVISWFEFSAGDFDNTVFRALLSSRFDFGAVDFLLKDELFLNAFNAVKPANYPFLTFTTGENIQLKSCDSAKSSQKWTRSGDQFLLSGLAMSSEASSTNVRLETNQNLNRQRFEAFLFPTVAPTNAPTPLIQTVSPTLGPSAIPTASPIITNSPSFSPTVDPTTSPSQRPSFSPTIGPSTSPSQRPSFSPTIGPSTSPTQRPSFSPTIGPSTSPSQRPSFSPTVDPTISPSQRPSFSPTIGPSTSPSQRPSFSPTVDPTESPSQGPSFSPNTTPTGAPSETTTSSPTVNSSPLPTELPTQKPSFSPTVTADSTSSSLGPTVSPTTDTLGGVDSEKTGSNFLQNRFFYLIIGTCSFFFLVLLLALCLSVFLIRRKNRKYRRIKAQTTSILLYRSQMEGDTPQSNPPPRRKVFLANGIRQQNPMLRMDSEFPTFEQGFV